MKQRLLLLGLFVCALACDSANPIAPSGTVLSVTANPSQITLNGQSTITITGFKPDANRLNPGTQIVVTTSLGNLFHPTTGQQISVVEIDGDGLAVVLLRADGRAGDATVTARLSTAGGGGGTGGGDGGDDTGGGTATSSPGSVTVQIGADEGDRPTVVISANPSEIAVLGSSRIQMLGRNSDNTAVSAGQRIRLTADLGALVADGGSAGDPAIDSVLTDSNGEAFATYIAGDRAGDGMVTAILGTSDEFPVMITINDAPATFSFQASPRLVNASAGDATISLRVDVLNAQGTPASGASAIFGASIGGTFASGSGVTTTVQGVAEDEFTVPQNLLTAGESFNVTARVIGEGAELPTQTIQIDVDP